jgi:hypothetical protein
MSASSGIFPLNAGIDLEKAVSLQMLHTFLVFSLYRQVHSSFNLYIFQGKLSWGGIHRLFCVILRYFRHFCTQKIWSGQQFS